MLNDPVNLVDPSGYTAQDVANAISFVRNRTPNYVNHSVTYSSDPAYSGRAEPRVTSFGKNNVVLNSEFLGPLDTDQKRQLLNTIYHENRHLQDGF